MQVTPRSLIVPIVVVFTILSGIFAAMFYLTSAPTTTSTGAQAASTSIKMDVSGFGYSPDKFVVPAGQEVTWTIKNNGASGCTNSLVARGLIDGSVAMGATGDEKVVKFTAPKPGKYSFSCGMGMVWGEIEAV